MPALRHCADCFAVFRASLPACPSCGLTYTVDGRVPDEEEGELEEVDPEMHRRMRKFEERQAQGLEALVVLGMQRGYKPAWAGIQHALRTRGNRKKLIKEAHEIHRSLS